MGQRLLSTLQDIHDKMGDRSLAVARELTKLFEETLRGRVSEVLASLGKRSIKGEVVIILDGFHGEHFKGSISDELKKAIKSGLSMKESVEAVAKGFGISKGEVYKEGLKIKDINTLSGG
ncbi:MAG: hypothetical protein Q7T53_06770 [Deltaproteobacteria bacterium]|nr:hypothetical protein [Deltaproteobacteria bacterium]